MVVRTRTVLRPRRPVLTSPGVPGLTPCGVVSDSSIDTRVEARPWVVPNLIKGVPTNRRDRVGREGYRPDLEEPRWSGPVLRSSSYGVLRVTRALHRRGVTVNRKRVARIVHGADA
ncbi:IS3 family transposase [Streptomyces sp. NPDC006863]|uniref:IS3 family transposase n=1 Tax=unclassified Streptomyces TaxID=2593676 RepID=UPI00340A650C